MTILPLSISALPPRHPKICRIEARARRSQARHSALRIKFVIDMLIDDGIRRHMGAARANGGKAIDRQHDQHDDMTTMVLIAPARQNAGSSRCMKLLHLTKDLGQLVTAPREDSTCGHRRLPVRLRTVGKECCSRCGCVRSGPRPAWQGRHRVRATNCRRHPAASCRRSERQEL